MNKRFGNKVQLVGDDLIVTNPKYIQMAIDKHAINASLIKINQIGSLTETFKAITMSQKAGFVAIISHRSGETEDTFIADLAVALNTGEIKTGSLSSPCLQREILLEGTVFEKGLYRCRFWKKLLSQAQKIVRMM